LAQATIIVESGINGGALLTAKYAQTYNKPTFAIPGRITDEKSQGCNWIIKNNKAILLDETQSIISTLNWNTKNLQTTIQFPDLSAQEKSIVDLLKEKDKIYIDEIAVKLGWDFNKILSTLFQLEIKGIIEQLPGNFYALKHK
jgi:DNA processing protein